MSSKTKKMAGYIPASSSKLVLSVLCAQVQIRHEHCPHISVLADNPEVWAIDQGRIRQADIRADAVERLEIVVPHSYCGGLELRVDGSDCVKLDYWQGSSLVVTISGGGGLLIEGAIDVLSCTLRLDRTSGGAVEMQSVSSNSFELDSVGRGSVDVRSLVTESCTLRAGGRGDVMFISLQAETIQVEHSGRGEVAVLSGSAKAVRFDSYGTGDALIKGEFDYVEKNVKGNGRVSIRPSA